MSDTQIKGNNNDTKKIVTMLVLVFTLMFFTTSATYAWFAISASDTSTATGTAATVGLDLTVTRVTPTSAKWNQTTAPVTTKVMVPQLDAGLATAMNSTNSCVDGNGNVVCQVYEIKIENTSTSAVRLRGAVYFSVGSGGTFNNLYWRQTTNANTMGSNTVYKFSAAETTNSTATNAANSTLVADVLLQPSNGTAGSGPDYAVYYVVVWIREMNYDQGLNQTDTTKRDQGTWIMNVSFKDKVNPNAGVTSTITS